MSDTRGTTGVSCPLGTGPRADEVPDESAHREQHRARIREAKARLEQEQADKDQRKFTAPESRIMPTTQGRQQCYNGQLAVDDEFQIIQRPRFPIGPWGMAVGYDGVEPATNESIHAVGMR